MLIPRLPGTRPRKLGRHETPKPMVRWDDRGPGQRSPGAGPPGVAPSPLRPISPAAGSVGAGGPGECAPAPGLGRPPGPRAPAIGLGGRSVAPGPREETLGVRTGPSAVGPDHPRAGPTVPWSAPRPDEPRVSLAPGPGGDLPFGRGKGPATSQGGVESNLHQASPRAPAGARPGGEHPAAGRGPPQAPGRGWPPDPGRVGFSRPTAGRKTGRKQSWARGRASAPAPAWPPVSGPREIWPGAAQRTNETGRPVPAGTRSSVPPSGPTPPAFIALPRTAGGSGTRSPGAGAAPCRLDPAFGPTRAPGPGPLGPGPPLAARWAFGPVPKARHGAGAPAEGQAHRPLWPASPPRPQAGVPPGVVKAGFGRGRPGGAGHPVRRPPSHPTLDDVGPPPPPGAPPPARRALRRPGPRQPRVGGGPAGLGPPRPPGGLPQPASGRAALPHELPRPGPASLDGAGRSIAGAKPGTSGPDPRHTQPPPGGPGPVDDRPRSPGPREPCPPGGVPGPGAGHRGGLRPGKTRPCHRGALPRQGWDHGPQASSTPAPGQAR